MPDWSLPLLTSVAYTPNPTQSLCLTSPKTPLRIGFEAGFFTKKYKTNLPLFGRFCKNIWKHSSLVRTICMPSCPYLGFPSTLCSPSVVLWFKKAFCWDFPGGPVVKNLPSNAEDVGSIPGRGTKIPHAVGQLSLHATTTELTCLN